MLQQLGLFFIASLTPIQGEQFTLFHVKFTVAHHLPFVVSMLAKCLAAMLFFQGFALERKNVAHFYIRPGGHWFKGQRKRAMIDAMHIAATSGV